MVCIYCKENVKKIEIKTGKKHDIKYCCVIATYLDYHKDNIFVG